MPRSIPSAVFAAWLAVSLACSVSGQAEPGTPPKKPLAPPAPSEGPSPQEGADADPPRLGQRLDSIAVVVNGEAITWAEIRRPVLDVAASLEYRTERERQQKLLQEVIRQLKSAIESKLLVQMARAAGDISVTSEELDQAVLEQQRAAGSLIGYMRSLKAKGLTVSQARESERERLLRQKFFQANFFSTPWGQRYRRYSVRVSPREIRDYYRKNADSYRVEATVWLRQIVIPASAHGGAAAARALAERVRADLSKGEPPEKVNATYKLKAADLVKPVDALTSFGRDSGLRGDVKAWAFSADAGAVADVIELGPGLLAIFQLAQKRDESTRGFEAVQDEIRESLRNERWNRQMNLLVARLFREADIRPAKLGAWLIEPRSAVPIRPEILEMLITK